MDYDECETGSRLANPTTVVLALIVVACLGAVSLAYSATRGRSSEVSELRGQVKTLDARLDRLEGRSSAISGRLDTTEQRLRVKDDGVAPLAARILDSVFTVQTSEGLGAGFAAWTEDRRLHVVTADHVIPEAEANVTLERKEGAWSAEVVGRDPANDLAVLRIAGRPVGAKPLVAAGNGEPASPRLRAPARRKSVRTRGNRDDGRGQPRLAEADPDRRGREPRQLRRPRSRQGGKGGRRARFGRRGEHQLRRADPEGLHQASPVLIRQC